MLSGSNSFSTSRVDRVGPPSLIDSFRAWIKTWSKPRGLLLFLVFHICVAALSAFRGILQTADYAKLHPRYQIEYPAPFKAYAFATNAEQGFGFFAPAVSADVRFVVRSASSKGGSWHDRMLPSDFAADNSLGTFLGFGVNEDGPRAKVIQEILAKSVATGFFNRYPEDNLIVVQYQAELLSPLSPTPPDRKWINLRVFTFYR